jgi:cytochrome P450
MSTPLVVSRAQLDEDPHGVFRRVRSLTPILQRDDGIYLALRAADVETLATDPRTRQMETEIMQARGITSGGLFDFYQNSMLFSSGPTHRKRRAPLSRAFAFRLVAELRPRIRTIANELIQAAWAQGELNLLDDYAAVIPARVIASILGLPPADIPHFTSLVYRMSVGLNSTFPPSQLPDIDGAARDLAAYVDKLLTAGGGVAGNEFLASFVEEVQEDGKLRALETVMQIVTVILGGSDTTRGAMTMLVAILLEHPEQWNAVCRDPTLIPGAVLEALRYEPPVASFPRFTLEDVELGGRLVPANRVLIMSTLSAMRDPAAHADPDIFNIRRTDHRPKHLVFGGGAHRCLGEALAKVELEEGLAALTTRLPALRLVGDPPVIRGHAGIRRVSAMRVGWQRN